MWKVHAVCLVTAAIGIQAAPPGMSVEAAGQEPGVERGLIDQYCVTCHSDRLKTGGLTLEQLDFDEIGANAEVLEKVVRKLRAGQMPPEGQHRPDQATLLRFVEDLESGLDEAAAAAPNPNPGWIPSHRLNRAEYVNAIRDLLALEIDGSELLPADMAGFGFDNNAEVLSITPGLLSRYMTAATKISRLAIGSLDNRPVVHTYKSPPFARQTARMGEDLPFASRGGLAISHVFPLDGEYTFRLRLQRHRVINGEIAENEYQIEVRVDHALVKRFTVGGKYKGKTTRDEYVSIAVPEDDLLGREIAAYSMNADKELEVRVPIKAGTRVVSAAFVGSVLSALDHGRVGSLRGIGHSQPGIDTLEIGGPFHGKRPENTASRQRIFVCRPPGAADEKPCARRTVETLARRAFRQPVTPAESESLLDAYRSGRANGDFETGIERALETLLTMPQFLIRIEQQPVGVEPGRAFFVSDLELASRLSFFLWKSIPDDELIDAAIKGQLKNPAVLEQHVRRMAADPQASRWMADFVGQWLQIRNVTTKSPNPILFPEYDETLRDDMIRETELLFESQVREDRSVLNLLRANYTFINARLAEHYGIPDVYGSQFRHVTVSDPVRRGLLGHASVLTATSYEDRTSVVLRGKWVMETLLGAPPPPPPPNVPPLQDNDRAKPTSLRERMEQHRRSPVCASCHAQMDPLGFALENFDAIGRWREDDLGAPIDSAITMNGVEVADPSEFGAAIANRTHEYLTTVVEKLLTYAMGRGVQYYDAPVVREIIRATAPDYRWSSLILQIVKSAPFQMRRAPEIRAPGQVADQQ